MEEKEKNENLEKKNQNHAEGRQEDQRDQRQ